MNYAAIKYCDIANGPGVRTSLFVSGCRNHCKGCFQPETWDFAYGKPFDATIEKEIIDSLAPEYVTGLTLLGGDPFEPENQKVLAPFMERVREIYPDLSVWAYTGYLMDKDLCEGGKVFTENTSKLLSYIDVLVDGPFVLEEKNIMLKFRGSNNQRVIDVKKSLESGEVVEVDLK
ncbi:MAG: anaerobic ribonucleoside-triphosphate reductase activating protein [Lachnospiraceae bacterium]|nr:anaerobic ribonucleoside-triphosphate reductase activating protein [Lachnospiraceae bacterium]